MTRRRLYQFVSEMLPEAGSPPALLRSCVTAMQFVRNLPAPRDAMALRLAEHGRFARVLHEDDALGLVYQALNAPALESAYRAARRDRRKFTNADIPAVTQLFTPRWVVEFLLHNTLGRLWLEMHPDSRIELSWLVERPHEGRAVKAVRDITILDPACGTMNFGVVAIELLDFMYREELDRAGQPGWADPSVISTNDISSAIARQNLFGIDIDPVALDLARATLEMKLRAAHPLNLRRADALFDGGVDRFDVVVTNPPYLSARNLSEPRVRRLKRAYPASWRDAGACFIDRAIDLLHNGGRAGILAMQSFMFTGSFEALRAKLDETVAVESIAHFGGGLFEVGNPGTLQTAAVVVRREALDKKRLDQRVIAFRLVDAVDKRGELRTRAGEHHLAQRDLARAPRRAWAYWLPPRLRDAFTTGPTLAQVALPRQGLATTDNARFVRYWWEVDSPGATPDQWKPYVKSGRFRRWHEAPRHRVDWADDGAAIKRNIVERYPYLRGKWAWVAKNAAYYGRAGVTYSYLTSGRFSARRLVAGAIFDVAGSALFPDDALTILGVLNSSTAHALLGAINPTVNFQVGDLAQLPVPRATDPRLCALVGRAIDLQRTLDSYDETATDFVAPMPWEHADEIWRSLTCELHDVEARIDRLVARLYGVDAPPAQPAAAIVLDRVELAQRWVAYALRQALPLRFARVRPIEPQLLHDIRACLPQGVERTLGGIERFLACEFFAWHAALYNRRPIYWILGEYIVRHDCATRANVPEALRDLPDGWERFIDDGIAISLAPLRRWVRDAPLRSWLEKVGRDLDAGRFAWSATWAALNHRSHRLRAGDGAGHRPRRPARARRGARPVGT